jgi:GR25 family glycosyltransferase involved in LPS biosynthesis
VLVLEDDIDIEWDVKKRLQALLVALPNDWDIVYLGKSENRPSSLDNSP